MSHFWPSALENSGRSTTVNIGSVVCRFSTGRDNLYGLLSLANSRRGDNGRARVAGVAGEVGAAGVCRRSGQRFEKYSYLSSIRHHWHHLGIPNALSRLVIPHREGVFSPEPQEVRQNEAHSSGGSIAES